jgi:hypothetical protein
MRDSLQPSVRSAGQNFFNLRLGALPVGAAIWHYYDDLDCCDVFCFSLGYL